MSEPVKIVLWEPMALEDRWEMAKWCQENLGYWVTPNPRFDIFEVQRFKLANPQGEFRLSNPYEIYIEDADVVMFKLRWL